jgi:hypothetical protein
VEIVYGRSRHPLADGKTFRNARFFDGPVDGATRVYLLEEAPEIAAAYERIGVEVVHVTARADPKPPAQAPVSLTPAVADDERGAIYIPDDWAALPWSRPTEDRDLTLRGLSAMFSAEPVLNKAEAKAAIEAELARREQVTA